MLSSSSSLLFLLFGGEIPPPPKLIRHLKEKGNETRLFNIYGITEVSCWASFKEIVVEGEEEEEEDGEEKEEQNAVKCDLSVSIGPPMSETEISLVDVAKDEESGRAVGEVVISSKTRFCRLENDEGKRGEGGGEGADASSDADVGEIFRRTGDLGYRNEDGEIVVVGRTDNRIKIWGKRMDLEMVREHLSCCWFLRLVNLGVWDSSVLSGSTTCYIHLSSLNSSVSR